jgi:hypothetical protein
MWCLRSRARPSRHFCRGGQGRSLLVAKQTRSVALPTRRDLRPDRRRHLPGIVGPASWNRGTGSTTNSDSRPSLDRRRTPRRAHRVQPPWSKWRSAPSPTAPGGARPRPLIAVVVDDDDSFSHLCELFNGAGIRPGEPVPYLSEIDVHTIIFDRPVHALTASTQRTFTGALRRAMTGIWHSARHRRSRPPTA